MSDNKKETCENCICSMDYGESVTYIKCERMRKYVEKSGTCKKFAEKGWGNRNESMQANG